MITLEGWIKLHRQILDNPVVCKDAEHLAVWTYLLLNATHEEYPVLFGADKVMLQPGQLITGRKKIAQDLKINESKVKRILNVFKNDQQIDQQTCSRGSLITVLNWEKYQTNDQQIDQQVTSERPASDQQVTTNKNIKNVKNDKKDIYSPADSDRPEYQYREIVQYLNDKAGTKYKYTSQDTRKHIKARYTEGYTFEDFCKVIDNKVTDWMGTEYQKYLRPSTLFGNKFENYLNQLPTGRRNARSADRFNNFEGREQDYDQLERDLLGK